MLALTLALGGCGGSEPPSSETSAVALTSDPSDEPGSTRASREAAREGDARGAGAVAPGTTSSVAAAARPLLVTRPIDVARGEDGHGATVAAGHAIAFDLDARRFPARAMDPILSVGDLRFVHYAYTDDGALRYVVADRALLTEGAEVSVQYGEDASTRLVVSPSLSLGSTVTP